MELRKEFFHPPFRMSPTVPQLHERLIHNDSIEPGRKAASARELGKCTERQEERLLDSITRVLFVEQEAPRHRKHAARVGAQEFCVSFLVAQAKRREDPCVELSFFR